MELISPNGRLDFEADLKEAGGLENLARTPYARNMWSIMKQFKVFPAKDGLWYNLTDRQASFILAERRIDIREEEAASKGQEIDHEFYDDDTSWYDHPELIEEESPEEIQSTREQLDALMDDNMKENMLGNYGKLQRMRDNSVSDLAKANEQVKERLKGVQEMIDSGRVDELKAALHKKRTGDSSSYDAMSRQLGGEDG